MLLLITVFVGVFLVTALLIAATGINASQRQKIVVSRLDAALAAAPLVTDGDLVDVRKRDTLSAIPLLNRLLQSLKIAPRLRLLLYQANMRLTLGSLFLLTIFCYLLPLYLIDLKTDNLLLALSLAILPACLPLVVVLTKRRRRFYKFQEALPGALDLMVSALRSGHSLFAALELVAHDLPDPVGPEFRICCEEHNFGVELRVALANLLVRVPLQDVRIIVTAILIQKETGGNLAEVLEKTAFVIRERFRLQNEIRIRTAQGRLTGLILTVLPIVLGFALFVLNPKMLSVLWTRPLGQKLLITAGVMVAIGSLIIRKIVSVRI